MKSGFPHARGQTPFAFVITIFALTFVHAEVISTRTALLSELGTVAVTEDFETYKFPTNSATHVGTLLDTNSILSGQGPGLVKPGVRFLQSPPGEGLQWDRQFSYGLQSAAMVTDDKLVVDFTTPVTHVGFDVFWFNVTPNRRASTIEVYAGNDTSLLYSTNFHEPSAPNVYFFGYKDTNTIGRVVLYRQESEGFGVSPMIDNLTFGSPLPSLSINAAADQVVLSWPQAAGSFQLETSTNLLPPASWTIVTNTAIPSNGTNTVTLPIIDFCKFFRLHGQ